jgi:hypothetical protein
MTPPTPTPDSPTTASPELAWSIERIRALGAVTDVPTAGKIFHLSRSTAYDLAKRDAFPVPVLRVGTRYRVPVAGILTALGVPPVTPPDQPSTAT